MVFGQDIVFTFGPLGALDSWMYWPSIYLPSLMFWAALSGLSGWLLIRTDDDRPHGLWQAAAALLFMSLTPDTALMLLPLAYCADALRNRRRDHMSVAALVGMSALVLIKVTLIPLCLAALVCAAVLRDERPHWRFTLDLALIVLPALLWWRLLDQPFAALAPYLALSFDVTRGYAEAMSLPTREGVAIGLGLCGLGLAWLLWQQARAMPANLWQRLAWPGFVLFSMLIAWRHSITRGDGEHLVIGFSYFGGIASYSSVLVPARRKLAIGIAVVCFIGIAVNVRRVDSNFMNGSPAGRLPAMARGLGALLQGHSLQSQLDAALLNKIAEARTAHPALIELEGGFDILGYEHDLLLATDVREWKPRPIFQSYSVYTPVLAALNARFLESDNAPHWLIAPVQTIDGRLPTMDDPALWPLLRSHYRVNLRGTNALLLERRQAPADSGAHFAAIELALSDWTHLPALPAGTVYAQLQYDEPAWRRALGSVWQPAQYYLEYRPTRQATPQRFRLVPAIARSGFLLLPILTDTNALADWIEHPDAMIATPGELRLVNRRGQPVAARLKLCPSLPCPQ